MRWVPTLLLIVFIHACAPTDQFDAGGGPIFNPCQTNADCGSLTPLCKLIDVKNTGGSKWCTADCPTGSGQCVFNQGLYTASCLGIDANGHLDPFSNESVCFPFCAEYGGTCPNGTCIHALYGGMSTPMCVPSESLPDGGTDGG